MSRRHQATRGQHRRDDESRYKRDSNQQPGLTDRLLGHDAKERITSTLKALGIYKGFGGGDDDQGGDPSGQEADGNLDLPAWDVLPKSSSEKVDRHHTKWTSPEDDPAHGGRSDAHLREHGSDYSMSRGDDSRERSGPNYEPNSQFDNLNDTGFSLQYSDNNMGNAPYGQEQQSWSGGSYTQHETSQNQEGNFNPTTAGSNFGPDNDAWNSSQSSNPQSGFASTSNQNPVSAAFSQPWQHDDPNLPPFNEPSNLPPFVDMFSSGGLPSSDSVKDGNLGRTASSAPRQSQPPRGMFDIAKKTSYVNPSRPNLKPLVEVTISNPAALAMQKGNIDPSRGKSNLSGAGKDAKHARSGTKRSNETPNVADQNIKRAKQWTANRMPGPRKGRPLVAPGERELEHYKNDPERLALVMNIMKGSPVHQMEIFHASGMTNLQGIGLDDWKCYICKKKTNNWQNYVSHCTSKYHRGLVHKLRTNTQARDTLRGQLFASCSDDECEVVEVPIEVPDSKEKNSGAIHPCDACGRFYSKSDGLDRHLESDEHKQRVLFLMERFGESWKQYQWYNQASQPQDPNPEEPVGVAFVVPISGFFCKLCSQFYNSEVRAKDVHCRQGSHIKKVKEWDRTSKGSLITIPLDANEIALAVKKNDGGSSPPRSQTRSRSSSRIDSHPSRGREGRGSSERGNRSRSRDTLNTKSKPTRIPGLDLDDEITIVADLSDVSDDEDQLPITSAVKHTNRRPKFKDSEKSQGNEFSSLEEGELSVIEVRQMEKNQETEKIVREWEKREKQRRWLQEQEYEKDRREEERVKEREKREKVRKERERKDRAERERKAKDERERKEKERKAREEERLEEEKRERERAKRERERLERERERLERERDREKRERDREERERKAREEERLEKERLEKERLEKERLEKERLEKKRLEKEKEEKEKREREEQQRREKEKKEQQARDKLRLEQEIQIQEERLRLQEAKEQLERTRKLQEQREQEFKDNQIRERSILDKRIWEQQMRERELMDQQLRQQQLDEQRELEKVMSQQQISGERMTDHQRRELERRERELQSQHSRERQLREAELRKHQEAEHQRLQEEQLKEQELRRREMMEAVHRETAMREDEQRMANDQAVELREQKLRTERLLQVNLEEQEARDRTIREQGFHEWQRREENMRASGVPDREIALRRDMFEREIEAAVVKDAEMRAQQLGEVLHNPEREGDLREKVIQQQQLRERREVLLRELRENAILELQKKEMDLRREKFAEREIEEILTRERRIYEEKILVEMHVRGLAEGPSWEGPIGGRDQRAIDAQNVTQERSRDSIQGEQEGNSRREGDRREEDERNWPRDGNIDFERRRSDHTELDQRREEEFEMRRREEEEIAQRQQAENRAGRSEDVGDIVIHEMGGLRNVQLVGKRRLPPGDLREELREREKGQRSSSQSRRAQDNMERTGRKMRPERSGNQRGRGRKWRGQNRRVR